MKTENDKGDSAEPIVVSAEVLRTLCDTTVRLAEIRQRGCSHLCVENFAEDCLAKLIRAYAHNATRSDDSSESGMVETIPSDDRKKVNNNIPSIGKGE